ncbi:MAG: hypothetical protein FJ106_01860 [Deltaproteobacteria bacterium]|nr:hypothetical protein [Deltaproteobacteria bacterium]
MKNTRSYRYVIISIGFMIIFSTLTFASGEDIYRNQGIIMGLDLRQKMMIVNERTFTWDQTTIICNEKGSPINIENFKTKAWVYIEGMREKKNNPIRIEKIYLLPKYVDKKERHLYPFFQ